MPLFEKYEFVNEGGATAIDTTLSNRERGNEEVYDLHGHRVKSTKKGFYIKEGKIVLIK